MEKEDFKEEQYNLIELLDRTLKEYSEGFSHISIESCKRDISRITSRSKVIKLIKILENRNHSRNFIEEFQHELGKYVVE